ncbi:ADP compounds hydrolase NudE [Legionella gresilensis]|uniref:ADP compounds hydrolase NudE n=1 Tax=Legionella gresilensis TaxID=91823 RepID=UPI0010417EA7|nr:ADP compounds hydrolase NudE [Legionella gresilensis]
MTVEKRQKPICKKRTILAKTQVFTIEQLQLHFSNGEERIYERVGGQNSAGAVLIVAITADDNLLLVREYGAGVDDYTLAFPKGVIELGEEATVAANRELQEEVGFAAKELYWLKSMTLSPGYFTSHTELVLARDLYLSSLPCDEPEPIEVIEWPLANYDKLLSEPSFSEARSIAALFLIKQWLERKNND